MAMTKYIDDPFIKKFGLPIGSKVDLVYDTLTVEVAKIITDKSITFTRDDKQVEIVANHGAGIIRYNKPYPLHNGKPVIGITFDMTQCTKFFIYIP